jgi:hypothetical protein
MEMPPEVSPDGHRVLDHVPSAHVAGAGSLCMHLYDNTALQNCKIGSQKSPV